MFAQPPYVGRNQPSTDRARLYTLFSPTETALQIQRNGGIGDAKVRVEGHVIYDTTLYNKGLARKPEGFDTLNITMHDPSSRKH